MEKFVSVWGDGKTLPESYIFPPEQRPGDLVIPKSKDSIPIIDLAKDGSHDHPSLVSQIMQASQVYGCLQVINHGVSRTLMDEAREMFKEFFELPTEEKSRFCSVDKRRKCILYTSYPDYEKETHHVWRDTLKHKCTPLKECVPFWPQNPPRYREIVAEYVTEVKEVGLRILKLMCEGLGLGSEYFAKEFSQETEMFVNHYPPCPDPRLTLGVAKHSDRSLKTVLTQGDIPGLQVFKDGDWIGVHPIPHAFVVNIGHVLQVISNGKLKNGDHRVVTNTNVTRQSVAVVILPKQDSFIEPAKALVNDENPSVFKSFKYQEFLAHYDQAHQSKHYDRVLDPFMTN